MRKAKTRIGSILLVVAMLMTLLPTGVFAHWVDNGQGTQPSGAKIKVEYYNGDTVQATRYFDNVGNDDYPEGSRDHFWDPITVMSNDPALSGCTKAVVILLDNITLKDTTILIDRGHEVIINGDGHTITCTLTGTISAGEGGAHVAGMDAISIASDNPANKLTLNNVNLVINGTDGNYDTQGIYNDGTLNVENGATIAAQNLTQNGINGSGTLNATGTGTKITVTNVGGSGIKADTIELTESAAVSVTNSAAHGITASSIAANNAGITVSQPGMYGVTAVNDMTLSGTTSVQVTNQGAPVAIRVEQGTMTVASGVNLNSATVYTGENAQITGDGAENVTKLTGVAAINNKCYNTLAEAMKAAADNDTVKLLKSVLTDSNLEIPANVTVEVPNGVVLTVGDKMGITVAGALKANEAGDNVKGASDSAWIQLSGSGTFKKADISGTAIIADTAKYVWSYLKNDGTAVVAKGEWKNVTEDLVATAEYWQARVDAQKDTSDTSLYKPTWEELRNLTYFCQKAIEADTKDTANNYTSRTDDVDNFITATITKLDMSNKTMIKDGDSGILARYTGLTYLNLDNTGLTEVGGLAGLRSLKVLNLSNNSALADTADSKVLGSLENLTALTDLNISNTGVSDLGGILKATGLTTLNISNTKVTNMNFMWNDRGSTAQFTSLTDLTAKNLSLDSISGLVEIVSVQGFDASTSSIKLWDLSGSTILYTHKDHVDAVEKAMVDKFNPPAVIYPDDGGSTTTPTSYGITVSTAENGTVKSSNSSAAKDATVTITVTPNEGYVLDTLTVTDKDNNTVALTKVSDTQYTFKMPASAVTVKATFKKDEGTQPAALPFNDVSESEWFYEAVKYVYDKGMMNGVSDTSFAPYSNLTRGMIAQVLYNLEGKPAVSGSAYTDVAADQWYNDAVNWAAQKGIVTGYGDGTFGPMDNITREQMAAILYRYAQYKGYDVSAKGDLTAFTDGNTVSDWAKDAMSWAVGTALFNGKGDGILDPTTTATRAEVAKILMTYCENVAK